jgi:pyruvate dehydrogenase E2 component (dihydrolipoamide acetyltransferase)
MVVDVKLPEIGEGITSGGVLDVLVKEGDVIAQNQDIVELETDKATMGVPSTHAGKVVKVHVKQGDTVPIGGVLVSLEPAGKTAEKEEPKAAPPKAESKKAKAPEGAEESETALREERAKKPQTAKAPAPEAEADAEPDGEPLPAAASKPKAEETATPSKPKAKTAPAEPAESESAGGDQGKLAAGPAVRRFAREVGVDLTNVSGSGPGGRITREDVLEVVRQVSQGVKGVKGRNGRGPSGESDDYGPVRYERLSRLRRTVAERMHQSWSTVARVTNFDDADVTELEKVRQASKADYEASGIKLTALPFLIKSCALALRKNPLMNATIDLENDRIIYKNYVNIGIAVDTDRGLVVPVLRGADELSISEIAKSLATMAESVRSSAFKVEDLRGGTFTISNLGAIGGTYSTPVVNVPEVAILLVGKARKLPVVVEDEIAVRLMMPLSLSYDHRLIDGATAARFLNEVISYLKAPGRLLLAP